jgi:hypothetical protein
MANELQASGLVSGVTYYAVIRSGAQYYNSATPGFENYNAANWANYAIDAAAANTAGDWVGNFPSVSAGHYGVEVRQQAAGSAAVTDALAGGPSSMNWSGTAEIFQSGDAYAYLGTNLGALGAGATALGSATAVAALSSLLTNSTYGLAALETTLGSVATTTTALSAVAPAHQPVVNADGTTNANLTKIAERTVNDPGAAVTVPTTISSYAGGAADADAANILAAAQAAQTAATATETRVNLALPNAAPAATGGLITFGTGPGQIEPNGDGSVPATGSATPAPGPNDTIGTITTYDQGGTAVSGVSYKYWMTLLPSGQTTGGFPTNFKYATSGASGLLSVQLIQGATYVFETMGGSQFTVPVPTGDESFNLGPFLGQN